MAKRKIIVFSNANGKNRILDSEAKTWGDLKAEIGDSATGNVEAVVKGTRNTLNLDSAELPTTEFTVMLVAKKMKSGAKADRFSAMKLPELKKECTALGIKAEGKKAAILKSLRKAEKAASKAVPAKEVAKEVAKEEATKEVDNACEEACDGPDELSVDEAKTRIKEVMESAKDHLLTIIDRIKCTTVQEGIDLFEGLDEEWKEIQDEVKRKG